VGYFSGDYCLCPIPDVTIGIQALEHGFLCKKICLGGYVFFFFPCRCDSLLFQKLGLVSRYILKDVEVFCSRVGLYLDPSFRDGRLCDLRSSLAQLQAFLLYKNYCSRPVLHQGLICLQATSPC